MRLIAVRSLFVLACLSVPQFIDGGKVLFAPSVNLWRWGQDAVNGFHHHNFSLNNPDFLWTVLQFFMVPIAFALWFHLLDMLRIDTKSIAKRSKLMISLLIPAASWVCMVLVFNYSIGNGGPFYVNYRAFVSYDSFVYSLAFALLLIEYLTYFIAHGKK